MWWAIMVRKGIEELTSFWTTWDTGGHLYFTRRMVPAVTQFELAKLGVEGGPIPRDISWFSFDFRGGHILQNEMCLCCHFLLQAKPAVPCPLSFSQEACQVSAIRECSGRAGTGPVVHSGCSRSQQCDAKWCWSLGQEEKSAIIIIITIIIIILSLCKMSVFCS